MRRVNVDAMLRELTARQFLDWQAMYEIESFGERRADSRAAFIVRALYNIHRDHAKTSTYTLDQILGDFVSELGELEAKPNTQTPEEKKSIARMIVDAFNKVARG